MSQNHGYWYIRRTPAGARMRLPGLLQLTCLALGALAVACDSRSSRPKAIQKLEIAATVLPLADVARQVGGGYVNVTWVVETGQSLDGILLSSTQKSRLVNAELTIAGGATEPWATEGFDDPLRRQRVIRLDLLDSARQSPGLGLLWLDPVIVEDCARELTARLALRRPEWEGDLRLLRDQFLSQIRRLNDEYEPRLRAAQCRSLLVLNNDYNPMLLRYGLEPVPAASVPPSQIGDSELRAIKFRANERNTRLLIIPADTPELVRRELTLRGGLQMVPLDSLGSSAANGRSNYIELMRFNLEQLARATAIR